MHIVLHTLDRQLRSQRGRPWVVAYSGGLDSTVLLHALCQLSPKPAIRALHIHHGLHSQADQWQDHCRTFATSLGVAIDCRRVQVQRGEGIEAAARDARYRAFQAALGVGDVLLQAHHQDDQAETLLLRLFRGTGPHGLRGIPRQRELSVSGGKASLLRPLLDLPRQVLEEYAQRAGLDWVEDPSNADTAMDRNYLRHIVLPTVEARWPAYRKTLARYADIAGQSRAQPPAITVAASDSERRVVDLSKLRALAEDQRADALRHWLRDYQLAPSAAQLQDVLRVMLGASEDSMPVVVLGEWQLRRFQGRLYLTSLPDFDPRQHCRWDGRSPLVVPGAGTLSVDVAPDAPPLDVLVGFRQGGERCHPTGRGQSQRLKKLLQEAAVPPWRRDRLPLLYLQGELAAVADLWLCRGFEQALAGRRFRWRPCE